MNACTNLLNKNINLLNSKYARFPGQFLLVLILFPKKTFTGKLLNFYTSLFAEEKIIIEIVDEKY